MTSKVELASTPGMGEPGSERGRSFGFWEKLLGALAAALTLISVCLGFFVKKSSDDRHDLSTSVATLQKSNEGLADSNKGLTDQTQQLREQIRKLQDALDRQASNTAPPPSTPSPAVRLSIERPVNNGTVAMLDDVQARVVGAHDEKQQLWVLVQGVTGSTVFPQGPCNIPDPGLSVCLDAQFGDSGAHAAGTEYKVTVVMINSADAAVYRKYYATGFVQGAPPVRPLASSQTITVRRR